MKSKPRIFSRLSVSDGVVLRYVVRLFPSGRATSRMVMTYQALDAVRQQVGRAIITEGNTPYALACGGYIEEAAA